jgi:hypothetical protein
VKVTKKYFLTSEDVRKEEGTGQLIVIGLFVSDILPNKLPMTMSIAFTWGLHVEGLGDIKIEGKLRHVESDTAVLSFTASGTVEPDSENDRSADFLLPFRFKHVKFDKAGTYEVSLKAEGQEESIVESFRIAEPKSTPEASAVSSDEKSAD